MRMTRYLVGPLLAALILLTSTGCPRPRSSPDPTNIIYTAEVQEGKIARFSQPRLPDDAFSTEPFDPKDPPDEPRVDKPGKIHPVLEELLAEGSLEDRIEVVVNFSDNLTVPFFPEPDTSRSRDSSVNQGQARRAAAMANDLMNQRTDEYDRIAGEFGQRYQAEILEEFWLVKSVRMEVPLGTVRDIAARQDVLYIEPNETGEEPPNAVKDTDPANDVQDGRSRIVSDPYFNLGQTSGYIGLLDTGIRPTHTLFNSPSNIDFVLDCVNGGPNCSDSSLPGWNPNDTFWDHGTSSAAIITANNNLGFAYRGVTGITVDSFKVYPNGGLNTTAAIRGFQRAILLLDRVIVAEMQGSGSDTSAISTAADNAFNAGAVIIAANGNFGPDGSTVRTPANAHKVIGVGNFDVKSLSQVNSQSRGPAPDGRWKPDIQCPTNTETASAASDTALKVFTGTSGATPYAAGAAALLRNWLKGASGSIDPGQVYAQLILSGSEPWPYDNTSGAGPIRLPTNGWAWWGKVNVSNGATINIPITISSGSAHTLDAAIWWPETPSQSHNDIDLHIVSPSNVVQDSGLSIVSVFERARVDGSVVTGTWKIRIRGYSVPTGIQTVYWAAHVRN